MFLRCVIKAEQEAGTVIPPERPCDVRADASRCVSRGFLSSHRLDDGVPSLPLCCSVLRPLSTASRAVPTSLASGDTRLGRLFPVNPGRRSRSEGEAEDQGG